MPALIDQPAVNAASRRAAAERCLAELGLGAAELAAVTRRGFISRDLRGRGTAVYKLRFRCDRRQRVDYLGTDAGWAGRVQEALREPQQERQLELALSRLHRYAAMLLRDSKRRLAAPLAAVGIRFHGRAVRRPRSKNSRRFDLDAQPFGGEQSGPTGIAASDPTITAKPGPAGSVRVGNPLTPGARRRYNGAAQKNRGFLLAGTRTLSLAVRTIVVLRLLLSGDPQP